MSVFSPATFVLSQRAHEQVATVEDEELKNMDFPSLWLTWCGRFYFPKVGHNKISDLTFSYNVILTLSPASYGSMSLPLKLGKSFVTALVSDTT